MARILGLDLGSYAVKAVVLETTMRGTEAGRAFHLRRPEEGDRVETLRAALAELGTAQSLEVDQVVVSLPGPALATHLLTLPFGDTRRIEATLPFEIEAQLPFDLSEAVFDYQPTTQTDKKTDLFIGVVRKDELRALLEMLQASGLDARVVTHPGLAYHSLLTATPQLFEPAPADQPLAILDIGHERTTLAIGKAGGGVEFARTFAGGGKDFTRLLAAEFQTSLPDANAWKEDHGAIGGTHTSPEAERASGAFVRALQPLLRELRPTLKAYTARARQSVGSVFLCGGTAALPGLSEQLTRDLGMPCQVLPLPQAATEQVEARHRTAQVQAFALAQRGQQTGAKSPRFNLRRGELAFKGDLDFVRERLPILGTFAAVLLVLMVASGIVRGGVLSRREHAVDQALCELTQKVLGRCEKNFDRALNLLRGSQSPMAALPKSSAVGLLADVTQRIPEDVPVTFDQIVVELDRITLRGETDSPKQIDKISGALKGHRCFREVNQGKVEKGKDGQKVLFRLDVQVDCGDAAPQG